MKRETLQFINYSPTYSNLLKYLLSISAVPVLAFYQLMIIPLATYDLSDSNLDDDVDEANDPASAGELYTSAGDIIFSLFLRTKRVCEVLSFCGGREGHKRACKALVINWNEQSPVS